MATPLGVHAHRLASVRVLRSPKGRREQHRFAFEGATLLEEARAADYPIEEIYATQAAYDATPLVRELDERGTRTFIVEPGSAATISDLTTPSGIVAVAPIRLQAVAQIFSGSCPVLVLADINDPANAGTLLRSADAFGCCGVVFGGRGIDPFHPKVVRGAMGAIFRLQVAVAEPPGVAAAAAAAGATLLGLSAQGAPLSGEDWTAAPRLVVGNERHGLGRWESLCERVLAIPMAGRAESLSAGVAGSIALYEATRRLLPSGLSQTLSRE
ncbi:MAG TPA: RNA methyltransferase [Candidatus Cybelea sp.]|jgi:TrmH family RNA methyltransferase|nr:RNA methyltransferase [Candidatus Cybelea sp.]